MTTLLRKGQKKVIPALIVFGLLAGNIGLANAKVQIPPPGQSGQSEPRNVSATASSMSGGFGLGNFINAILGGSSENGGSGSGENGQGDNPNANTKLAVFLVKYADTTTDPFTADEAADEIFHGDVEKFFKLESYGKVILGGDVFGWVQEPIDSSFCNFTSSATIVPGSALETYIDTENIDLSTYDYTFIIHNCPDYQGYDGLAQAFSKTGALMGSSWWYGNDITWSPYVKFSPLTRGITHELGHLLGLYAHSNTLDCGAVTILPEWTDCTSYEAGDYTSTMGSSFYALGFHASEKLTMGWMGEDSVKTITESGTYTVSPLTVSEGTRLIKFQMTAGNGVVTQLPYLLEYRPAKGYAKSLSQFDADGLTLIYSPFDGSPLNVLDATPTELATEEDMQDFTLGRNETFTDPLYGLSIYPIEKTENGISFHVDFPTQVTCSALSAAEPVSATITPVKENNTPIGTGVTAEDPAHIFISTNDINANRQMVNLKYKTSNPNPDGCALQTFNVHMEADDPALFYKNYSEYETTDKEIYLSPGNSFTTGVDVIIPKNTAPGDYKVILDTSSEDSGDSAKTFTYIVTIE